MNMRIVWVLVLMLALVAGAQAYEKTVMVEYFSNFSCGPCAAQDATVQSWLNSTSRDDAAFFVYHVWWPGSGDWYYVANPNPASRWNYYVQWTEGVPYFVVDGLYANNSFSSLFTTINNRIGTYTPVEIVLNEATVSLDGTITAQVTVSSDQALSGYRLHAVLNDIDCPYGEAPNGIENYRYNVLDMVPNISGTDLGSIQANGSETFDFSFDMWEDHLADNYGLTFFVQNYSSHEILQTLYSEDIAITFPNVTVVDYELDDSDQVLPNGRPDPGESVDVILTLQNKEAFLTTDNLTGTISCSNNEITFSHDTVTWTDIAPGTMMSNASEPFVLDVPMGFLPEYVTFSVHFVDGSGYETDWEFLQLVGTPNAAMIDDSPADVDLEDYLFNLMLESGITMDILTSTQAVTNDITEYDALIWITSNATEDVLTALEVSAISTYLDQGGKVLLSGENIGEFAGTEDLLATYFKAQHEVDNMGQSYVMLTGVADGPFPGAEVIIAGGGAGTTEAQSSLIPLTDGISLFEYYILGNIGGVGYNGDTYSTVYLAFNLEAVSGINNTWRGADVIWTCMHWMGATTAVSEPAAEAVLPATVELSGYPNPFNAAMTVSYTLPSATEVQLSVINVLGQTVAELSNGRMNAGVHEVTWDASTLSSGVYFLNLRAGDDIRMQKVMLLK